MAARGCLLPSLVLLLLAASLLGVSHAARKGPVSDDLWEDLPAVQVLNPQGDPTNPCGHFDANDLQDAGNAHQPCYGALGEFLHCCLSGSSLCTCRPATTDTDVQEFGCYNYVAGSSWNAITGEECGYFFPEDSSYAVGRVLIVNGSAPLPAPTFAPAMPAR